MTVESEIALSGPYEGDGVNTTFDYEFKILRDEDLRVVLRNPAGAEVDLTLNVDYTVEGAGDPAGGSIEYPVVDPLDPLPPSPLQAGWFLALTRGMEFVQETDLENQGGYYPETLEVALDRVEMKLQELRGQLDRTLRIGVAEAVDPDDYVQILRVLAAIEELDTYTRTQIDGLLLLKSDVGHTHVKAEITDFNEADYATGAEGDLAVEAHGWGDHAAEGYLTAASSPTITGDWVHTGGLEVGDPGTEQGTIQFNGATFSAPVKINQFDGAVDATLCLHQHSLVDNAHMVFARSNSGDATHGNVASGQALGDFIFSGWHTNSYWWGATIGAYVDGTPGSSDMPTRLGFFTSADGTAAPVERMRIDSRGLIVMGDTASDALGSAAGSLTVSVGDSGVTSLIGDELVVESAGPTGITVATPNNTTGGLFFADPEDADACMIRYNHSSQLLQFQTEGVNKLLLQEDGRVQFPAMALAAAIPTTNTDTQGRAAFAMDTRYLYTTAESNLWRRVPFMNWGDLEGADVGSLTVSTGDSGVSVAQAQADDLIVEGSSDTGISVLSPDANTSQIMFGGPGDLARGAAIRWQYGTGGATNRMIVGTRSEGGIVRFDVANASERFRITPTGTIFSTDGSDVDLVGAASAAVTISTGNSGLTAASTAADELILEGAGNSGITIATPNTSYGSLYFGDPEDADVGGFSYDHGNNRMLFTVNAGWRMAIDSTGRIITGNVAADPLGVASGSVLISTGDSGVTDAINGADDLVIESNSNAGISILTPNTAIGFVTFGDPENNAQYRLSCSHVDNYMRLNASASVLTLDSTGRCIIDPDGTADCLGAEAGAVTISTGNSGVTTPNATADDLVIESDGDCGITIATPAGANVGRIVFADTDADRQGRIQYNHALDVLALWAGNTQVLNIYADRVECDKPFKFPSMTTTERNALTPAAGWTIFNTTTTKVETYDGSTWQAHW